MVESIQSIPSFIEKGLPVFVLLQISDFIRNVFVKAHPKDIERSLESENL